MNTSIKHYAPGMRVVIRDAEWVIRRVDNSTDGGQQLSCDGISELVRDKSSIFLTQLEGEIQILDPAETQLVADTSSGYANSLLYIESQLRRRSSNDGKIQVAHQGAMDLVPYQLDPALQALEQPRQRILIADAVGLGKTLEAGILTSELIQRGRGKRILVLTQKSMLTQFQKEFWNRFTIPLTRLDSIGLQRVRNRIPSNHNPFYYYDKSIISIDTLKQDSEYRVYLEQAYWDIIIIDECHNVADRGTSSLRTKLAKLLATRSDTLIMLSATPHDGRARSFASLMNMLDPTAISDPENYVKEDFSNKGLVVRRFKHDIQHQVDTEFKERKVFKQIHTASPQEEAAYDALLDVPFTRAGEYEKGKPAVLLRVTLQKSLFSSPAACLLSVSERIRRLTELQTEFKQADKPDDDIVEEVEALKTLQGKLSLITPDSFSKYSDMVELLKSKTFGWKKAADDRLVIFSERIETLNFLLENLSADMKLKKDQITIMHGGMSDIEQQQVVEAFGKPESKIRVLLCSDVASEGINLHYQSHRLFHFDMPWSLMVFQQRNGRVDRYGQEQEPEIYYLLTESANDTIRGDMRILEVLQEKDEQAYQNIGDPSAFMGVYDVDLEEKITEDAMANHTDAVTFSNELKIEKAKESEGAALMSLFTGTPLSDEISVDAGTKDLDSTADVKSTYSTEDFLSKNIEAPLSLFENHYAYTKRALAQLNELGARLQVSSDDQNRRISLVAPDDLRHRFKLLPREIAPADWQFVLSDDQETIKQEIARSREDENAWPKIHYLWPQHPLVDWLQDRMLAAFGRHTAPVLEIPLGHCLVGNSKNDSNFNAGDTVFILSGLIPNRKSHPLVNEWIAVHYQQGRYESTKPFADLLAQLPLGEQQIPNREQTPDLEILQALLPDAVTQARDWVLTKREVFETEINAKLNDQLEQLEKLRAGQLKQLELGLVRSSEAEARKAQRKALGEKDINEIFDRYIQWIEDTLTTEKEPYLQVISVLTLR